MQVLWSVLSSHPALQLQWMRPSAPNEQIWSHPPFLKAHEVTSAKTEAHICMHALNGWKCETGEQCIHAKDKKCKHTKLRKCMHAKNKKCMHAKNKKCMHAKDRKYIHAKERKCMHAKKKMHKKDRNKDFLTFFKYKSCLLKLFMQNNKNILYNTHTYYVLTQAVLRWSSTRGKGQWHWWPPGVFVQSWEQPPFCSLHSSMSIKHTHRAVNERKSTLKQKTDSITGHNLRWQRTDPHSCVRRCAADTRADTSRETKPAVFVQVCSHVSLLLTHSSTSTHTHKHVQWLFISLRTG